MGRERILKAATLAIAVLIPILAVSSQAQQSDQVNPPAKTESKGPMVEVEGRVLSAWGPVAGARVRAPGMDQYVLTDKQGNYRLKTQVPKGGLDKIAAGKEGWFNNGATLGFWGKPGDISLNPVYFADRPDYQFISPATCFSCHGKVTRIWNGSKMAQAAMNPKYLDMYYGTQGAKGAGSGTTQMGGDSFKRDNPNSQGSCTQCHAPSAAANPLRSRDPNDVLNSPLSEWPGVSCDYCHKVRKVVPDSKSPSGHSFLQERQTPRTGRSILIFGPYDDVVTPPMAASYSPVFDQGEFCASCHGHFQKLKPGAKFDGAAIYSPQELESFKLKDKSILPIQTTYQEWKGWQDNLADGDPDKGKRCQYCHMSWQKRLLPYDNFVVEGMARSMYGGTYRQPRDIRPHHFEGGTAAQLQNAVSMELEGEIEGNRLTVKVHVSNTNGGHWVPTGEPMRNVLLLVDGLDEDEKPLKLVKGPRLPAWAGKGDPAKGNYAGLPGAAFAKVLADDKGNLNVPFWRATRIKSDTRLRPKTIRTLTFVYELNDPDSEPSAEARLIYRPVVKPLAEAKKWHIEDIAIASKAW